MRRRDELAQHAHPWSSFCQLMVLNHQHNNNYNGSTTTTTASTISTTWRNTNIKILNILNQLMQHMIFHLNNTLPYVLENVKIFILWVVFSQESTKTIIQILKFSCNETKIPQQQIQLVLVLVQIQINKHQINKVGFSLNCSKN